MKKLLPIIKKRLFHHRHVFVSALVLVSIICGFIAQKTLVADVGRGALWGGAIGGIAGGRRGALIGLGAGALAGAIGSASSSRRGRDPYRQLDREQRKLTKLENRLDRTTSDRRRMRLQNQISRQRTRIADLEGRLGIAKRPGGAGSQPQRYQAPGYKRF